MSMIAYLDKDELPENKEEARKIRNRSFRFFLFQDELYRKSFTGPFLLCVGPGEANVILKEIHEGECGSHIGGRSLALKTQRAGYYWPNLSEDAMHFVRTCIPCQKMAPVTKQPAANFTSLSSPLPFAMWGIDIVGKLPASRGGLTFAIVAVDYFTKWVEAKAVTSITCGQVKNFLWKNIITRYGVPRILVSDNGAQFEGAAVAEMCEKLSIERRFSPVCYPQANGQVEVMNKTVFSGIKKNIVQSGGQWADELDHVLWSYRTTPSNATGETPFCLVYGAEAVLPIEVEVGSFRVASFSEKENGRRLMEELDLVDEKRDKAFQKITKYKQLIARFYNRRVKGRAFQIGDLVLRLAKSSMPTSLHKLSPKWEGPYRVARIMGPGSYKLEDMEGRSIGHSWHAVNLRKFYT